MNEAALEIQGYRDKNGDIWKAISRRSLFYGKQGYSYGIFEWEHAGVSQIPCPSESKN